MTNSGEPPKPRDSGTTHVRKLYVVLPFLLLVGGCGEDAAPAPAAADKHGNASPAPTNRIAVPDTVRQNLGITFAKVERRAVATTIRVPGRFELLPSARREHRATLAGWVRMKVAQYDAVKPGTRLAEIESPEWHRTRKSLHEAQAGIETAAAGLAVAEGALGETRAGVEALARRVTALAGAEVRRAELEADLATRRASIPRLEAEVRVKQAALGEARHDFALGVDAAAALLGVTSKSLLEPVGDPIGSAGAAHGPAADRDAAAGHKVQRWYAIDRLTLDALGVGIVEHLHMTDGAWVEANALVASVVDPAALRFRATGMQSDLGRLRDGQSVRVVPPQGSGIDPADALPGALKIGLAGDPDRRTIELLATPQKLSHWARPGVSALLEITVEGSDNAELAIPLSAVVRDELAHVFFRRDPRNPDQVIRTEADLGTSDGRWVVVNSGLKAGDEVVLDGVYELKLAGGAGKPGGGGGHFHADGTWHAEPDKK